MKKKLKKILKNLYLLSKLLISIISLFFLKRIKKNEKLFEVPRNNIIGFTSYPYKGIAKNFKGGDATVERYLKKLLIKNGYEIYNISYDRKKVKNGVLLEWFFGVPYVYSKIINNESKKCGFIICGSEVLYNIRHPKCINIFHISYEGFLKKALNKSDLINKIIYKKAAYIQKEGSKFSYNIAVSEFIKKDLELQGIKIFRVINNAVDRKKFLNLHKQRNDKILFAGSYSKYAKGFDILEKLAEAGYKIECITNFNEKEKSKLFFRKNVPHEEMVNIYNEYKILVFPSRYESFGLVPIEALACGLPIIMNNVGIANEIKEIEKNFVVENNSLNEFKEKIKEINENYNQYIEISQQIVEKKYSFNIVSQQWIDLLENITRNY